MHANYDQKIINLSVLYNSFMHAYAIIIINNKGYGHMAKDSFGNDIKPVNINDIHDPSVKISKSSKSQQGPGITEEDVEKMMGPSDINLMTSTDSTATPKPGYSKSFSDSKVRNSIIGGSKESSGRLSQKKKWAVAVIIIAVLVGLVGIGYLVVTSPKFVWWYGMSRTNKAVNKITDSQVSPAKMQAYSKSSISGASNATWMGNTLNGSVSSVFNSTTSKTDINLAVKSIIQKTSTLNFQLISQTPNGSTYPNVYFNVTGLSSLGIDKMLPQLSQYQGKWIVINGSTLNALIPGNSQQNTTQQNISSSDSSSFVKSMTKITADYLFTNNKNMAVFQNQNYIGKETINGVNSYHYNVTIDKTNASNYCQAIFTEVYASGLWQKLSNQGQGGASLVEKSKNSSIKSCKDSVNNDKNTYELWIDSKYHLVNQIRINENGNTQIYTNIGQVVQENDSVQFYIENVNVKSKSDFKATITLSNNSDDITGTVNYSTKGVAPVNASLTLNSKPSNDPVSVSIPTNAIPISDVLAKLGINLPSAPSVPVTVPKANN